MLVLFPVQAGAADPPPEVDALIRRSADAYGGEAALQGLQAMRQRGRLTSLRTGAEGPVERVFQRPDRFRIDIRTPGQAPEVRVLDGARAWKDGAEAPSPLRQSIVLQAVRFGLPLILLEKRAAVMDLGRVTDQQGNALRALAVPVGEGMTLVADLDPESGRILRSRGILSMGGATMEFATLYDAFRDVNGVLIPFREQHYAMGMNTGATVLDAVEVNPALPAAAFRP
ncbi:hypothetical protein TSO221_20150 [Azospirillum sp. TSO22-1]|nr:hypothetical protein TSO221_20150 [Azospirillum sp. TSO22-1]